jgi:hypothetical protein
MCDSDLLSAILILCQQMSTSKTTMAKVEIAKPIWFVVNQFGLKQTSGTAFTK